jgi:Flp pilus assembly pilin Flp
MKSLTRSPGGLRARGVAPEKTSREAKGGEFCVPTFSALKELLSLLRRREEGQTMAEYGIVLAVITIAAVAVFTALSGGIQGAINNVTNLL